MKGDKTLKQTPQRKPGMVPYLRVSTEDMQNPENSFEYQRQRIQDCMTRLNLDLPVVGEYSDILSGKTGRRPDYQRMLKDARAGRFSHIGIYSVDRLGRNTQETLNTLEELTELGVEVMVADSPNLDMETPSGNLLLRMRVIIAQYEIEMMSQRIKDTKRAILSAGGWPATLPDGYSRSTEPIPGSKMLAIELDPERAKVWREAWDLLLEGSHTLDAICQELHNRGYTRKTGNPWVWTDSKTGGKRYDIGHLSRTFHAPFYAGWVISPKYNINRGDVRGLWPPLVSDEEFDRGVAILRKNDENKVRVKKHAYMLSGLLYMRIKPADASI